MRFVDQLLAACDAYCDATGMKRSRLSTLLFSRGTKLDDIALRGGDLVTGNFQAAMSWLSQNWPEGAEWPDAVPRPDGEDARPGEGPGAATTAPASEAKRKGADRILTA